MTPDHFRYNRLYFLLQQRFLEILYRKIRVIDAIIFEIFFRCVLKMLPRLFTRSWWRSIQPARRGSKPARQHDRWF